MADAKQIKELNQATTVNSTDALPMAQASGSEAVQVTVEQLATAVGELNETGALRELELATSIGKNVLAQRLTEKGIPTTAEETLVDMADKVGNLVVSNQWTNFVAKMPIKNTTPVALSYGFSMQRVDGEDFIIYYNEDKKIYYCLSGEYVSIQDMLEKAVFSISVETSTTSRYCFMGISSDEKYIILDTEPNKFEIYEINKEAKTLSLFKTITTQNQIYNSSGSNAQAYTAITNDLSYIAFISTNQRVCLHRSSDSSEISLTSFSISDALLSINLEEENPVVYVLKHRDGWCYKVIYNFDTSSASYTSLNAAFPNSRVYKDPRVNNLLVTISVPGYNSSSPTTTTNRVFNCYLQIYNEAGTLLLNEVKIARVCGTCLINSNATGYPPGTKCLPIKKISNGIVHIIFPFLENSYIEYNYNTNTFGDFSIKTASFSGNRIRTGLDTSVSLFSINNKIMEQSIKNSILGNNITDVSQIVDYSDSPKFLGYVVKNKANPDADYLFAMRIDSPSQSNFDTLYASGVFDYTTSEVPLE